MPEEKRMWSGQWIRKKGNKRVSDDCWSASFITVQIITLDLIVCLSFSAKSHNEVRFRPLRDICEHTGKHGARRETKLWSGARPQCEHNRCLCSTFAALTWQDHGTDLQPCQSLVAWVWTCDSTDFSSQYLQVFSDKFLCLSSTVTAC